VLLAATGALLTAASGLDGCGIVTMANNRFQPERGAAISKLNRLGFHRLELADRSGFGELLART
jgi:hypothetical protein